jgi:potassium-transporting ATPase KdpC subunit
MTKQLRPAVVMIVLMTILLGLAYPLGMTGLARAIFPAKAEGSLIVRNDMVVGSSLIGQAFTTDRYFHPRPSATTGPDSRDPSKSSSVPYNAASSMGSNLGPSSKTLLDRIRGEKQGLAEQNPSVSIPIDLVTTSGSGLDPHVSPEAAYFQVPRVARSRNMPEEAVRRILDGSIEARLFGVLGEPRVNVLALNLALDAATPE